VSRRGWLVVTGVLAAVLGITLTLIDPATVDEGNPSIVAFEFAWDEEGAGEILSDWGEEGRDAARLSLWLDFAYLLAYGAFFTLAAAATRDLARARRWERMASIGPIAVVLAPAGAAFDALEDVNLLIALGGDGGDVAPLLGSVFACLKFGALAGVQLYILAGLALRLAERARRG
jgi:hypothetical protein